MGSGLVGVQARVASIQQRIATVAPAAGRDAAAFAARLKDAVPAGTVHGMGQASPLLSDASSDPVPVVPGAAAPVAGPAAGAVAPPSAPAGASPGAWADRLPPAGRQWAPAIQQTATAVGVDPALLAALVQHESGFDPSVRSHAGAIGLTQLMPGTARGLGVDPTDPMENLRGGATYLRQQLDRFGRVDLALAAYNAGPNRVAQAGGVPRITETRTYVDRVMRTWEALR